MEKRYLALAGQVLVAGFPAGPAPEPLVSAIAEGGLGGVILFKRNLGGPAEVAALVAGLADRAPPDAPLLVAVDQEGGRVARLGAPVVKLPPMRRLGELDDPGLTKRAGAVLGAQLRALGFTMDFAPVLDVDTNPDNPVIGDRSFGRTPDVVIRHGVAFAEGLHSAGLLSCGKHFPGHGDTDLDSHLALPKLAHPRERLDAVELAPFVACRGTIPMLMSAHVVFDALDREVPATLSPRVMTGLLRNEMGYDGVLVSDDLEMKAVADRWGVAESAVRAIDAGCDCLLVCSDVARLFEARDALARRASEDPVFADRLREAAKRFLALRREAPPAPERDPERLLALLDSPAARDLEREIEARLAKSPA
ncbi:MAG: beta-N-acetylhexosaminidase [Polyangiales bacterium]